MKKNKIFDFLNNSPAKFAIAQSYFEVNGNQEARIEGCRRVLEYDEEKIRISVKSMSLCFNGRNLKIKLLNTDSLLIQGFIKSIEFHL
ncbi:MAG: YabP/YqfC family sporulation protein [Oscillospiraceae bacterium]|jgi:sporulation protein YqfC|nr:YabP/YqfC family sporulation protein [Oscillospiraceae bacterium]